VAVVSSVGAFVYSSSKAAVAHVQEQVALSDSKVFKSGELYFNS
jgi:hypothetical protein